MFKYSQFVRRRWLDIIFKYNTTRPMILALIAIIKNINYIIKLFIFIMTKILVSVGIGACIGLSPLRNSWFANVLIAITGG